MTTSMLPSVLGPVLSPGDAGFDDEIASWNAATRHQPLMVVGATCAEDVSAAVRWAGGQGLAVAVQATGHGAVRPATDCLLITTSRMQGVSIDPATRTARVAAGVRWSRVIEAAARHGLAPLNGSSSQVGVVGYTLGGGLGPLGRRYGFAADHVRSIEIVTADGALRTIDATREGDLFWAVRGGKGNFGIVTAIEFDLFEVPGLFGGGLYFAAADAAAVLHEYRTWSATLPDEMSTSVALLRLPPLPELPEPLRGKFVAHLRVAYLGGAEEADRLLAPMRAVAPALIDAVAEIPYPAIDSVHRDPVDPTPTRERGVLLDASQFTAERIDAVLAAAGPEVDVPLIMVELRHLGGAFARPPAVPNAVSGRGAEYSLFVIGLGLPGLVPVVDEVTDRVLAGPALPAGLINFSGGAGPEELLANWSPADRDRLLRVKQAYDSTNVFSTNQAIVA